MSELSQVKAFDIFKLYALSRLCYTPHLVSL